jgi:hypothetical protein
VNKKQQYEQTIMSDTCAKGVWVTEPHAIRKLGISSGRELNEMVTGGKLPHVVVERGAKAKASAPFNKHRFYYITAQGQNATSNMTLRLIQWVQLCQALGDNAGSADFSDFDPRAVALLARYTGKPIDPDSFGNLVEELKQIEAVILPDVLSQINPTDVGGNGVSLDTLLSKNPGTRPVGESATVSGPVTSNKAQPAELGEIYIRADGKKVRRVKKPKANSPASLSSHLGSGGAGGPGGDSATVPGDLGKSKPAQEEEGEIYIRADGKKVRRVKKKKADATLSLGSMLDQGGPKVGQGDSATVPGDLGKSSAPSVEEGEIYIRADGKKVRRVKKKPAGDAATVAGDTGTATQKAAAEEGEIYIRADGKKVRRVKKPKEGNSQSTSLDSMLRSNASPAQAGSGSATVTGAECQALHDQGEIYIRPDGKKVRRIKKTRSVGKGLGSFLGNGEGNRPTGGSATVSGDGKELGEIYIRADGKKVRRVKKTPQSAAPTSTQSLAGFLGPGGSGGMSGSATVSGDMVTGGKANFAEGEIYIRPDGKKVRRIKKTAKSEEEKKKEEEEKKKAEEEEATKKAAEEEEARKKAQEEAAAKKAVEEAEKQAAEEAAKVEGEEAAQPSGEAKPEEAQSSSPGELAGFLDKAAGDKPKLSGSATVAGDMVASTPSAADEEGEIITLPDGRKVRRIRRRVSRTPSGRESKSLGDFLGKSAGAKPTGGSATVAGGDGEGEIIVRPDGTKVRRIRRPAPGGGAPQDQEGEIITRPDGTKVRRIVRKTPVSSASAGDLMVDPNKGSKSTTLDGFLGQNEGASRGVGDSATVAGDMVARGSQTQFVSPNKQHAEAEESAAAPQEDQTPEEAPTQEQAPPAEPEKAAEAPPQQQAPPAAQEQAPAQAAAAAPQAGHQPAAGDDAAHAYIVVVGDEDKANGHGKVMPAPDSESADPTIGADGEQRFAVKVSGGGEAEPQQLKVETDVRYLTLDELANLSGQSKDDLNEVVKQKMNLDKATPRFVLQPLDKNEDAAKTEPSAADAETPAADTADPDTPAADPAAATSEGGGGQRLPPGGKLLPEGMEAVPEDVAEAARAVKAMGATDLSALMEKLKGGDVGELLQKLKDAEKRQAKLEKQLQQAGVAIADDIPYEEAKEKVEEIAKRMNEIGGSDVQHPDKEEQTRLREEYFKLEQEMERYNTALMLTDEYQAEQDRIEKKWEEDNSGPNMEALRQMRRHMPVNIRNLSEAALTSTPSPNGKFMPKAMAKKFKRTNVLMLIRINPEDIERMHPSTLENMRVTGLTLTERRALYEHLRPVGPKWNKNKAEKMTERKWTWYQMMKNNFKESLAPYERHIKQYGPPEDHPYATRDDPSSGCPLIGKQCPVRANKDPDYTGDLGWTPEAEYEASSVTKSDVDDPGAKAMQEALELAKEKKANERAEALKKHYKGVMFVSKANGSCEQMDESMDKMEIHQAKWTEDMLSNENFSDDDKKKQIAGFTEALNELKLAVLDFATRAGMQTSGKKKAGGDGPDTRSAIECSLSEEVFETSEVFFKFIKDRMEELKVKDTRVSKTIELLEGMLGDLHGKNEATLKKLGVKRNERSRRLKTSGDIKEEAQKKLAPAVDEPDEAFGITEPGADAPMPPRPPRAGLLDAIAGRGRGGRDDGGRGGLMAAIAGRGRGGDDGGRGGLMAAIAGRGRGGGGDGDGGRGGLMAAIAARGRGGGGDRGGGGGRGGLLAAIAARGGG